MKIRLVRNTLLLFFLQFMLFIIPLLIYNIWFILICFVFNGISSFCLLKDIEKRYYKKYNKWDSMLYMFCPFLGILILTGVINHIIDNLALKIMMAYYIPLYTFILILNIIYIIIKHKR